jgi:subtilisin family serine protease
MFEGGLMRNGKLGKMITASVIRRIRITFWGIILLTMIVGGWGLLSLAGGAVGAGSKMQQRLAPVAQQQNLSELVRRLQISSEQLVRDQAFEQRYQELVEKVAVSSTLRVIVRLRIAYSPVDEVRGTFEAQAQRAEVARLRTELLNNLIGYDPASARSFDHLPLVALTINSTGLAALQAQPFVLDVQEDKINRQILAQSTAQIGATTAWASGYTGSGYTIAILDSGVDKTHQMLSGKIVSEACYSNAGGLGSGTSVCPGGVSSSTATGSGVHCVGASGCSHGTHVAGIAGGKTVTTSGVTFSGVARDANIIAVQVFTLFNGAANCSGAPTCIGAYDSDIIGGLNRVYALRSTYNISSANMSLGGGRYYSICDGAESATKVAIDTLLAANIATVVASGNGGFKDSISAPACISTAVSVGATFDTSNTVTSFSNSASFLNLLAPGHSIQSAIPGSLYDTWNGTSMAAPHVAGAWALIRQKAPSYTVSQVLNTLISTGVQITDTNTVTKPRINVNSALQTIVTSTIPSAPSGLAASVFSASQINISWVDNSNNEDNFLIYQKIGAGGTMSLIATVGANVTNYSSTGLSPATTYFYEVYARNSAGTSGVSNQVSATTPALAGPGTSRTTLSTNRTYYVSVTGSNSNDGLTSAAAFETLQHAINSVSALDISTRSVVISVGPGTFAGASLRDPVGSGTVIIEGAGPTLTTISTSSGHAILANGSTKYQIKNMKFTTSGSGTAIWAGGGSYLVLSTGLEFGHCATNHIESNLNSVVYAVENYQVTGGGLAHWFADNGGSIIFAGRRMTLSGGPAFSLAFAYASNLSILRVNANTYTGVATGSRYQVTNNSVIFAGGETLPGSTAGTATTGGQFQ